jgi:shikimate kinase
MNIILCGLPMSGKTTVGKILSQRLKWDFMDTDRLIEASYRKETGSVLSCREIFQERGEAEFRRLENEQLAVLSPTKSVVAVGGGSLMDNQNKEVIKKLGSVIYLKSSPELIWKRVSDRGIPAYLDQQNPEKGFYELARQRTRDYESAAQIIIDTDYLTDVEVVEAIIKLI